MTGLVNLTYTSCAVKPLTTQELIQLLTQAREKNKHLQITGMLLYQQGKFLQVLEGQSQYVEAVFQSILQDSRHFNITLLLKEPILKRSFENWSMGFVNLDTAEVNEIPGYTNYLNSQKNLNEVQYHSVAYLFINAFKNNTLV